MNNEEKSQEEREYEERLRHRLRVLQEQLKAGKVHIAEGLDVEKSLRAVRQGPDGEVDLDTVDGLVRSMALAVTEMHDREELKKEASLSEIQNTYFTFIERNFGPFYEKMLKEKITPHHVGIALTRNKSFMEGFTKNMDEFLNVIEEFWVSVGRIAHIHIQDMHGNIKGIFGGDLFPAQDENIASKCGIYTDTVVLPDPFLRSKHIFENYPKNDAAYYLIKHAMNILKYKELACAELDVPIIAILPDLAVIEDDERDFFHHLGKQDSLVHAGKLFGREFESFEELMDFASALDTIERAVAEIGDESRVLFDTNWTGNVASQLERALESEHYKPFIKSPGVLLASQSLGRMSVSNELLIKARRLNGTPIIDAPTSWQYLAWKMEYDAERTESATGAKDLHIVRGLQDLSTTEMEWLGNIPPEALIDIRQQGAMGEIREMLGKGIEEIVASNPENFHRSRDHVFDNINEAFRVHEENIEAIRSKKWKFAGRDVGSWIVVGSLGVSAAITGMPVWGIAAIAADQLLDAPKLRDIPSSIRELATESNKVKKSPVGMLFKVRVKNA